MSQKVKSAYSLYSIWRSGKPDVDIHVDAVRFVQGVPNKLANVVSTILSQCFPGGWFMDAPCLRLEIFW